jgi:hypothetical protein
MQNTDITDHHIIPHIGHVLVRLHDGRKDALVLLPDSAKNQVNPFGLVISVGEEVDGVYVGDKLIFTPNAMLIQIVHNDERFVFVKKDFILGKYVPNISRGDVLDHSYNE